MSRRSDSKYIDIDNLRFRLGSLVYSKERVSIYNMGSATECPTCAKGMCDVSLKKCYAARAENRFPKIKEARERQGTNWKLSSTEHFIHALKYLNTKHGIDLFRFNEASDFETQHDVDKMNEIASNVPQTVFGYTGNYTLDYSDSSFLVKMSHFNHICEGTTGRTVVIEKDEKPPRGFLICPKTNKNSPIKKCDEGCGICWKSTKRPIDVAFVRH